jgi:hypothetical protein
MPMDTFACLGPHVQMYLLYAHVFLPCYGGHLPYQHILLPCHMIQVPCSERRSTWPHIPYHVPWNVYHAL